MALYCQYWELRQPNTHWEIRAWGPMGCQVPTDLEMLEARVKMTRYLTELRSVFELMDSADVATAFMSKFNCSRVQVKNTGTWVGVDLIHDQADNCP